MLRRGNYTSQCALILFSGEFGVVYKGRLQWHPDAATEVVAVKTLKGIPFVHHIFVTQS